MDKLTIYTSTWCPDCHMAKNLLEEKGLEFIEIDIEKSPEAVETIIAARGKRVLPTLEYKGKFMDGNHFEYKKFESDLKELLA